MKWFKHISDSLDDPFIFDLMTKFGSDGYLVFFGTVEIYAREFKTDPGWKLTITRNYFKQKLAKRQDTRIINCLQYIATRDQLPTNSRSTRDQLVVNSSATRDQLPTNSPKDGCNSGKWVVELHGDDISIFIPKFRELLDESTLKKLREKESSFRNRSGSLPKTDTTDADADAEEEREKDSPPFESVMEEEKPKKRFVPPTIDEVKAYCLERKNGINPQAWIDHYTSNGWMVGKNHMKDWKAAIRTWEARDKENGGNGKRPGIISKAPTPYKTCPRCGEEYLETDMIVIEGVKCCPKCPQSREVAAGMARVGFEKIMAGIGGRP